MLEGYRRSLKHPEAEELFDLLIYRPLAWVVVAAARFTPVTPNQITWLSLAATLSAAYHLAFGGLTMLASAAALYALGNVLDCADGQLARVKGNGTPSGRIVDGLADYVGTVAIFLAIGTGFSRLGLNLWPETILAGVSSALHAMVFDRKQTLFLESKRSAAVRETGRLEAVGGGASSPRASGPPPARGLPGRLYAAYTLTQDRIGSWFDPQGRAAGIEAPHDRAMMRLWSFLGPTTNRTALMAFALVGNLDLYLWAVIVPGNLWLAGTWALQRQLDRRASGPVPGRTP